MTEKCCTDLPRKARAKKANTMIVGNIFWETRKPAGKNCRHMTTNLGAMALTGCYYVDLSVAKWRQRGSIASAAEPCADPGRVPFGLVVGIQLLCHTASYNLNNASHPKTLLIPMCPACHSIAVNKRDAPGHAELQEIEGRYIRTLITRSIISIKRYRCEVCGANWTYQDDPKDQSAGWAAIE